MKTLNPLFVLLAAGGLAFGQEYDDMYFNSKDRVALNASREAEAYARNEVRYEKRNQDVPSSENQNPTDSYSANEFNPEYVARENSDQAVENEDYFVEGYAPSYWNNFNTSKWDHAYPTYRSGWYGPNYGTWYSPYYGYNYFDPWNSWCDPYGYSGWSGYLSMSWSWGNTFPYGNPYYYNDPFYAYSSSPYYSSYYSRYPFNSYYYSPYYYPSHVVVIERNGNPVSYGKRTSRSTSYGVADERNPGGQNNQQMVPNRDRGETGRVATTSPREYYNPSWRTRTQSSPVPGASSDSKQIVAPTSGRSGSTTRSWPANNSSTTQRTRATTYTPSFNSSSNTGSSTPSYSGGGSSSGSRSSSSGSSGSSSGSGRSRGRD